MSSKCISQFDFDWRQQQAVYESTPMSVTTVGRAALSSAAEKTSVTASMSTSSLHRRHLDHGNEHGVPPYFVIALDHIKVMDGDTARFSGLVSGSPKPEVTWLHDGKPVLENPDFQLKYNRQTGSVSLEILEVFPQDGGRYECVANNVYGTASVSAQLTVEGD